MATGSIGTYLSTNLTLDALQGNHIGESQHDDPGDEYNDTGLTMVNTEFESGVIFGETDSASNKFGLIYSYGFNNNLDYHQKFAGSTGKMVAKVSSIESSRLGISASHFIHSNHLHFEVGLTGKALWPLGNSDQLPVATSLPGEEITIEFQDQAASWRIVAEMGEWVDLPDQLRLHARLFVGMGSSGSKTVRHAISTVGLTLEAQKMFSKD
jgi:hypothetical protein